MLSIMLTLAVSSQCFVDRLEWASRIEITKPFEVNVSVKKSNRRFLKRLYSLALKEEEGDLDARYFALAWMESRLRPFPPVGDGGRACGIFQIHARHSYPLFRRRGGYKGWREKDNKLAVKMECAKLRGVSYAVDTMSRLLDIFDKKGAHACHHNSGVYGDCNPWYEERLNFWLAYFEMSKLICDERIQTAMTMMRTGSPVPSAPAEKVQGYLDFMGGKDPQKKEDEVYMAGYALAEKVKKGEEQAPAWAV